MGRDGPAALEAVQHALRLVLGRARRPAAAPLQDLPLGVRPRAAAHAPVVAAAAGYLAVAKDRPPIIAEENAAAASRGEAHVAPSTLGRLLGPTWLPDWRLRRRRAGNS